MTEREYDIKRIEARMRERGYTPRGLSMKLFGKPDRLRNFFDGKSQNPRSDTYKAIMDELFPEENEIINIREFREKEKGLLKGLEMLILALLSREILPKKDLEQFFNHQLRDFRLNHEPGAAQVMDQLLDFLHSVSSEKAAVQETQSPQPPQAQSKKQKSLEN